MKRRKRFSRHLEAAKRGSLACLGASWHATIHPDSARRNTVPRGDVSIEPTTPLPSTTPPTPL